LKRGVDPHSFRPAFADVDVGRHIDSSSRLRELGWNLVSAVRKFL
jgi:hypothetical protein